MEPQFRKSKEIVLNIGTGKFSLHQTAETLNELGLLAATLSGVTKMPQFVSLSKMGQYPKIARLQNRMSTLNPTVKLVQVVSGEIFWQIATLVGRIRILKSLSGIFYFYAARRFDVSAQRVIRQHFDSPNYIYHFRAGFGGESVKLAKTLGIPTICDHSISHPNYDWWTKKSSPRKSRGIFNLERLILNDLNESDYLIVNSSFVADTFRICGDDRKLYVMTPPIDRKFVDLIDANKVFERSGVTFVGKCEFRKGIDILTEIVSILPSDIPVRIIGNWSPEAISFRSQLEKYPNIQLIPYLSATEITSILTESLIFLFPSRAEGSARVVGEAMHSGCIPLITIESGLPVNSDARYLINEMSPKEIANLITSIIHDKKSHLAKSFAAREAILEIERSYLPDLLKLYIEVSQRG